ncbi:MAG: DUF4347 domain-containing protein [Synechococcales cyanobacterium C42_A2020_086]|jgi:glucose/arabinose dehydrogenase|nr:DUF4347 domain-containing protein [Synechococcales cyanobacterium C42_A2020_086]
MNNNPSFAPAAPLGAFPLPAARSTILQDAFPVNELVLIGPTVQDAEQLMAGIKTADVVLLDRQDTLAQLTAIFAQHRNLTSVQVISHGDVGQVQLGNLTLTAVNLETYTELLQQWSEALAPGADLLFYGCNIAADPTGVNFVQRLADLTGADVAASDDLTGSAQLGGDWVLEVATGPITANLAIASDVMQQYSSILPFYNGNEYLLTDPNLDWDQAQAAAQRLGGNLVTINDAEEEAWLQQTFGTQERFWIGLNDRDNEGQFRWVSGEPITYTNWQPGAPIDLKGRRDFVHMNAGPRLQWIDVPTTRRVRGIVEIKNPEALSTIELEQNSYSVNEAGGAVEIAVTRTGNTSRTATIQYRTDSGTAVAGSDFTATSGTLTFNPGETRKLISIPIRDDSSNESNEEFSFVIESPTRANLGTVRTATITIIDDESLDLTINSVQVDENVGQAVVAVRRGSGIGTARVDFATQNGTALAGSDYQATSGTLTFADGELNQTVRVNILNDTVAESNETFRINFSNPVGVSLRSTNFATVTILDDDLGDFVRETIISGLSQPTAFAHAPGNELMFIAEKSGIVKVARNNSLLPTPFIDLSRQVNNVRDRGLLGITVHPEFYSGKPFVYLAYTYDPPEAFENRNPNTTLDEPDRPGNRPARIVRVTADVDAQYTRAVAGSQVVLVGNNSTWDNTSRPDGNSTTNFSIPESGRNPDGSYIQDYIKTDSESHTIGQLAFGADGALYASIGDGTSYNAVDPRTLSVLNPDSLSGKILRIDPLTGQGFANNPFYDGNPNSNRSKVWNLGLRNPFRFTIRPGTSTPFIGDVGWKTWEEVNVGTRGANFGWPAFEGSNTGSLVQPEYDDLPAVQTFLNSDPSVVAPIYARSHASGARAIIMGDFYDGTTFPSLYSGRLFVADVNEGTVDALTLDSQNRVTAVRRFDSGIPGIVYMETGLDGNLYFVNLGTGIIGRWRPVA